MGSEVEEIVFSVFERSQGAVSSLESLLELFKQEKHICVRLEVISWSGGWNRLLEFALHSSGPDLSEIGNTWVQDLARMNALRPFSQVELNRIVAGKDYFQSSWSGAKSFEADNTQTLWAMPFVSDVRMIYYRPDLLKRAGVDEKHAFRNISDFENTLARLQASGVEPALALPTRFTYNNLQILASWIWNAGGNFFNSDGTKLTLDTPEALHGIKAYFRLSRYLGNQRLDDNDLNVLISSGQTAVSISDDLDLQNNRQVIKKLGIASVLDNSFVGPNDLVVWQHSRHPGSVLELIEFLSRTDSGKFIFPFWGLPPYRQGWDRTPFNEHDYIPQMRAIQTGHSFPDNRLWALVENRISDLIPEIWEAVFANPEKSDEIVEREIISLVRRLRLTLES